MANISNNPKGKMDKYLVDDGYERSNVWQINPETAVRQHPAPYPIELPNKVIQYYSYCNDVVLDMFMGSGTTAIACINTNRNYIGFELDKHYCDIANERIQKALAEKEAICITI